MALGLLRMTRLRRRARAPTAVGGIGVEGIGVEGIAAMHRKSTSMERLSDGTAVQPGRKVSYGEHASQDAAHNAKDKSSWWQPTKTPCPCHAKHWDLDALVPSTTSTASPWQSVPNGNDRIRRSTTTSSSLLLLLLVVVRVAELVVLVRVALDVPLALHAPVVPEMLRPPPHAQHIVLAVNSAVSNLSPHEKQSFSVKNFGSHRWCWWDRQESCSARHPSKRIANMAETPKIVALQEFDTLLASSGMTAVRKCRGLGASLNHLSHMQNVGDQNADAGAPETCTS